MDKEMVSIIIPIFNGKQFLKQTIQSCLEQTYKNIEIILIDDNSSDGCKQIEEELLKIDNRIKLFLNNENLGFIETANKGINLSNGEFVILLGQDDILLASHIETILNYFEDDVSMVFCGSKLINQNNEIIGQQELSRCRENITFFDFSIGNCVNSCGLIMKKANLVKAGLYHLNEKWRNYGEWELWIRMLNTGRIVFCDEIKSLYRRHENNMTNTFSNHSKKDILRKYYMSCMKLAYTFGKFALKQRKEFWIRYTKYYIKSKLISVYRGQTKT